MSRRTFGNLGDSKGGDLLAGLKAKLTPAKAPAIPAPAASRPCDDLERQMADSNRRHRPHQTPDAKRAARGIKKAQAGKDKKNGVLVIKARTAEERALYRQAVAPSLPTAEVTPSAPVVKAVHTFGEVAFRKLAPLRESLEGFIANHHGPSDVPPADAAVVIRRVKQGAEKSATIADRDQGYFLGYDFGTSTTKVVARDPYSAGGMDEAFAIDVPLSLASGGQPHLFPTAVYWNAERDHFSLVPADGYILLDSFKSALIQGRGMRICKGSGLTMAEAATAFVALHLAYCLGAAIEEKPNFKLAFINVGIPVAVFDGQENVALFDRVLTAATRLVGEAAGLSRVQVKAAFESKDAAFLPFERQAELSGAIAGYCAATRHYLGGHMIIDCGSATLDIVTFDLSQQTHRPIGIYAACVENLGADACALYVKSGRSVEECRDAARFEEHLVYKRTISTKPSLFGQEDGRYPYQIILIGGGIHSKVYKSFLKTLAVAFQKPFHHPAIAPTLRRDPACEAGRLILADGLARDPIDLRGIALPKPPTPPGWSDPVAPGKEQV